MTQLRATFLSLLSLVAFAHTVLAQEEEHYEMKKLTDQSWVWWDFDTGTGHCTNGVLLVYADAVLTADVLSFNPKTGEAIADGHVRIQRQEQVWASEHLRYNFKTRQIESQQFRTGKAPVFASGEDLHAEVTNKVYAATNAIITGDDTPTPAFKVRASYIKIIPGDKIEAHNAVLYVEGVPIFYFPYYSRTLGERANHFNFVPGYRSSYGPYLLTKYTWFLGDELDGAVHVDYREKRGPGAGPDINYHFGKWGDGWAKYYYTHDRDPTESDENAHVPEDRQRVDFAYQANPATNLYIKGVARWQSDSNVLHDFLETEYRDNVKPNSFLDVNRFWNNFSLDMYAEPRFNDFLQTVERLPDVRLTGFRQEIGSTPLYYESESSAGYYRQLFPETNNVAISNSYSAARADTFHQLLLPETFFGFLNVTPRAGGRYTYYSTASGPGATTQEVNRGVFNTGAEASFKASRLWPGVQNKLFEVDGLRHIIEPSVNYVYVPSPNKHPDQIPQFDYQLPSLRLLPIDFPDYNSIDSIDSASVLRLGLFNKLQTKRENDLANVVNWNLYTDWRLQRQTNQTTFSDVYSDLTIKPRSWLTLESMNRYDPENTILRMAYQSLTIAPNDVWSWTVGYFYLRDDNLTPPTGLGTGSDLVTSSILYRLSQNWALRADHRYDIREGRMQEQSYSIYRDMRSFTTALSFRLLDNVNGHKDYSVAFTFSLKAFPRYGLGSDMAKPYSLLGS
jgi:lipopolysaccharide assembly outer membrane protein LptD (OstA)